MMPESEIPIAFTHKHLLDQISDRGLYKTTPRKVKTEADSQSDTKRIILHASLSINDVQNIDSMHETFQINARLYLFWEVNLHALGLGEIAERALDSGHYYAMSRDEINRLSSVYDVPLVEIFNATASEETAPADIRIYGGNPDSTALMWNKLYHNTCRQRFNIHEFPFDHQNLSTVFDLLKVQWSRFQDRRFQGGYKDD